MHRAHILLVDDNRLIRSVIAMHLVDHGYEVTQAGDGKAAVALVHRSPVDIIIMDLQMPVMDGITATRLLRSNSAFKELPIFAFTGQPQSIGTDEVLFTDVLVKPISPADVLAAIESCLPAVS
jgi:two-component system, sensor histidine kinase and response regulator